MTGVDNRDPFLVEQLGSRFPTPLTAPDASAHASDPSFGVSETKTARAITGQSTRQDPVAYAALNTRRYHHIAHRAATLARHWRCISGTRDPRGSPDR